MACLRALLCILIGSALIANPTVATLEAQTGTGGTVVVTVTREGTAMEGAFVALVGSGTNRYGGVTSTTGTVTLTGVAADTYTARAAAASTKVGTLSNIVVTDGNTTTATITVAPSGTIFSSLGAYGSLTSSVVADGRSGVFYLNNSSIPSLYRTGDYGGTWAPVTITSDDASNGITGDDVVGLLATSGYPGEIVAATRDKVWYSRDFGVTWASIELPTLTGSGGANGAPPATLHWAHPRDAGAPSRIFLVANQTTDIYYFDVVTGTVPTWTAMASSYRQAAGDKIAFEDGESSIFAAVVPAAGGSVTIYRVGSAPSRTADAANSSTIAGAAPVGAPQFIQFGGKLTGQVLGGAGGASPNTLLVYSRTATTPTSPTPASPNGAAVMTTFISGSWVPTSSVQFHNELNDDIYTGAISFNSDEPSSCHANDVATGSVAPIESHGTIGRCWIQQSGTMLVVKPVANIRNTSGFVYDADYGNANGNLVVLAGDSANMGAGKSDRNSATLMRPEFPTWPTLATGGFSVPPYSTTKGGIAITGLNAAVIGDTVFSPTSARNMAVVMSGGGRIVGSKDSGETWFTLEARGGQGGGAIDWWETSSGAQWLVVGLGAGAEDGNLLSAVRLASTGDFTDTTFTTPVTGVKRTDVGLSDRVSVLALAGLVGTDKAVFATARNDHSAAALSVVSLSRSGSTYLGTATNLNASFGAGNEPRALAYCPSTGSASSVADKLFVAVSASTEFGSDGTVFSIAAPGSASPGSPVTLAGATAGSFRDVRVDCTTGTVYVARWTSPGSSGLLKATTGSGSSATLSSLAPVTTLPNRPDASRVETLDISPSQVNRVVVVTRNGDIYSTTDGATTFSILNDTSTAGCNVTFTRCGRKFGAAPAGDIEIAPNTPRPDGDLPQDSCPRGLCDGEAMFGSSAGLYSADVALEPFAPTNFAASASGYAIAMTWTAATGGGTALDYLLEVALDGAFTQIVYGPLAISTTTSASLTAPAGTTGTFFLRLRARNASGTSGPSNIVSITLPGGGGGTTPGTPGTPQVTVNVDNTIAVTWAAPSTGATPTGYRVYLTTPSGAFPGTPVTLPAVTSVASPFPLPTSSYTLRVAAIAGGAEGPPSPGATFTIAGCVVPPSPPTGLTITKLGGMNVRLSWNGPPAATGYRLQASLTSSFTILVLDSPVGNVTTIDASGAPGTYYVRVVATNGCGVSGASNVVTVTLP